MQTMITNTRIQAISKLYMLPVVLSGGNNVSGSLTIASVTEPATPTTLVEFEVEIRAAGLPSGNTTTSE